MTPPARRRHASLRVPATGAAGAAVLAAVVAGVLVVGAARGQRSAAARDEKLRDTLAAAHTVHVLSLQVQVGLRGYLLARQPRYLAPWDEAKAALVPAERQLLATASATGDEDAADLIVSRVRSLVRDWQIPLIDLFKRDPTAGLDRFGNGEALRHTAEIQRLTDTLEHSLEARRAAAHAHVRAATTRLEAVAVAALAGVSVLVLLLAALIWRRVIAPVTQLARDVGAPEAELRGDEVAALERAFAAMAERVRDEQARLHDAHDRQEAILVACPLPVTTRDLHGRLLAFNPASAELFGWDQHVLGTRPEADPAVVDDLIARLLARRGGVETTDFVRTGRDGEQRQIRAHAALLHDAEGNSAGTVIIGRDVTDERRQRAQLHEALKLFESSFANAPDGVGLVTTEPDPADRRWIKVNGALCRILGYTEEELLQVPPVELVHPDDRSAVLEQTGRLTGGLQPRYAKVRRMVRKDGSSVWVSGNASVVRDEDGALRTIVVQYTDLSEIREATEALAESEHDFRVLAESTSDVIVRAALDGTRLYVSPASRLVLGLEQEELATARAEELVHPDDLPVVEAAVARASRGGKATAEYRMRHRDGHWVWVETTIAGRFDETGAVVERISVIRSIDECKQVEEERRALQASLHESQRLESLGILAGGIAHDFNNLLSAVLLGSEMLLQQVDDPVQRTLLDKIRIAGVRAADLCREMLAYSGKGAFVVEPVSLNDVVRDLTQLIASAIPRKAVLQVELDPALPAIQGDSAHIHQVVLNLITNAAEALEGGAGTVSIRTGSVDADAAYLHGFEPDVLAPGPYVFVEVADTGCGIEEATLARIFDPFFTTKFTGRGLGLAAVIGIARGHQGGIRVYTEPGKGTTFKVLFPASGEQPAATPAPAVRSPGARSGRLLLADDEAIVRDSVRMLLEDAGYAVVAVADGQAAVDAFAAEPGAFAAAILDLTMPGLNGEEAALALRRIDPDVPVIITSGFSALVLGSAIADGGHAGFLEKPFTLPALLDAIDRAQAG